MKLSYCYLNFHATIITIIRQLPPDICKNNDCLQNDTIYTCGLELYFHALKHDDIIEFLTLETLAFKFGAVPSHFIIRGEQNVPRL